MFQGMGMVVAMFLLLMEEEDAFWMTTAVIEELLPPSYYSPSLIGVQVVNHLHSNHSVSDVIKKFRKWVFYIFQF